MYKKKQSTIVSILLFPYELVKMLVSLVTALFVATVLFVIAAIWGLAKTLTLIIEVAVKEFVGKVCK